MATTAATSGACALVVGDILTFAGDTQTYVLTAAATQASPSTDVTLTFLPALKVAIASANPGVTISVKSSHVVNLGLHRDCIAFATRPFSDVRVPGSIIETAIDEITGIALRLEITREHKRTRWSFDALYGGKVVRPELGCRLAG